MSANVVQLHTAARRYDGQVYARLPTGLDERLRAYAIRHGVPASAVIRVALERFLAAEERSLGDILADIVGTREV